MTSNHARYNAETLSLYQVATLYPDAQAAVPTLKVSDGQMVCTAPSAARPAGSDPATGTVGSAATTGSRSSR